MYQISIRDSMRRSGIRYPMRRGGIRGIFKLKS